MCRCVRNAVGCILALQSRLGLSEAQLHKVVIKDLTDTARPIAKAGECGKSKTPGLDDLE